MHIYYAALLPSSQILSEVSSIWRNGNTKFNVAQKLKYVGSQITWKKMLQTVGEGKGYTEPLPTSLSMSELTKILPCSGLQEWGEVGGRERGKRENSVSC